MLYRLINSMKDYWDTPASQVPLTAIMSAITLYICFYYGAIKIAVNIVKLVSILLK